MPKPKLDFIYFDAGGGHRSAALALQAVMQSGPFDVHLVNLQEVLDPLDVFRKVTGIRLEGIYNRMLAKGWTYGSAYLLRGMHLVIRVYHSAQVKLLAEFWKHDKPDVVVSLVPNFNRSLFQSLRRARPGTPYVTTLTDFADYPPHFWMEKQPSQYFICGTQTAVDQAKAVGHPESRIFRTSGMIVRPEFYDVPPIDRTTERQRFGLHASLPTALVLFGGEGSNAMFDIAERLGNSSPDLQMILVCGRNAKLRERLLALKTRNRMHVEGFTKDIPRLMQMSDFLIGKPGPGSISEALQMNLPVIIERNACTLPQERYNADWILENGVGIVVENFRTAEVAVASLLRQLPEMKQRISRIRNRAVFEIPVILEEIWQQHSRVPAAR